MASDLEWDLKKENVAPVKHGRTRAALTGICEPSDSASKKALQETYRELWQAARDYTGDDPMEPWQRLVKWTQEYMTSGSKAELQKTLEICTKELFKLNRYQSDVRFLRIWIQYADCLPDPSDVFCFIRENQIGTEYALFYEAHATYYELKGNCPAADAAYNEGISRCAKPLERIKLKYEAFLNRMAQRIQRKIQEEGLDAGTVSRQSLTNLQQPQLLPQARVVERGSFHFSQPATSSSNCLLPNILQNSNQQQRPLQLAVDEEFQGQKPQRATIPSWPGLPQVNKRLGDIKPFSLIHKENQEKPGVWTGSSIPQNSLSTPLTNNNNKLEICVDDEFDDEPVQIKNLNLLPKSEIWPGQTCALQQKKTLHELPHLLPSSNLKPQIQTESSLQLQLQQQSKKLSLLAFDESLLIDAGGNEQSFEEARALAFRNVVQQADACTSVPVAETMTTEPVPASRGLKRPFEPSMHSHAPASSKDLRIPTTATQAEHKGTISMENHNPIMAEFDTRLGTSMPSATGQPPKLRSSGLQVRASPPKVAILSSQPTVESSQPDVTLSTLVAFDVLNDMFSDKVIADETQHASVVHQEPTVTISTKAAFDALNDMFSDRLPHEEQLKKRKISLTGLPQASKHIRTSDVCRLANGGTKVGSQKPVAQHGSMPGSSFAIYEDTECLSSSVAAIYNEDTQSFVLPGIGSNNRLASDMNDLDSIGPQGFHIQEDTEFLTRPF